MTSSFCDTTERQAILQEIEGKQNPDDVEALINYFYPNWLILSLDKYSNDYPHLQRNWEIMCQTMRVVPRKIILVDDIKFDNDHKIINQVAEYMTKNGYVVRRLGEFIVCPTCNGAIPTRSIWSLLKEKKFPVPDIWGNKCQRC